MTPTPIETEYARLTVLSASEEIAGRAVVTLYIRHKATGGGDWGVVLSPMQAIRLATELLGSVKELKLFET